MKIENNIKRSGLKRLVKDIRADLVFSSPLFFLLLLAFVSII
jgi:hypothetical protein